MTDHRAGLGCALGVLLGSSSVLPMTAAHAQEDEARPLVVDEIVVTASRREESLQEVPLSLTAVTSETLDRANVRSVDDLQTLAPSLNLGGRSTVRPQIAIRGLGTEQFTNAIDTPIGIFVDDVPYPRFSTFYAPFTDVERIEVLRGPQGTLYGRNTIAGAINIVTKAPTNELEAGFEVGVGQLDYRNVRGNVSGPLVRDALYVRVSGFFEERDGYTDNLFTGRTANGLGSYGLNGRLRYDTGGPLTIDLTADYGETDAPGEASEPSDRDQPLVVPRPGLTYDLGPTEDPFTYASEIVPEVTREVFGTSLRARYEGALAEFVSITAYRETESGTFHDNDGTELRIGTQREDETSDVFSQELRLLSAPGGALTFGDRLEWLLGAFYLNEETSRRSEFGYGADSIFVFAAANSGVPFLAAAAADGQVSDVVTNAIETDSYAVFGRGTVAITDALDLTLGARYSRDEKTADIAGVSDLPGIPPLLAPFAVEDVSDTFDSFDWDARLQYAFTPDVNAYVRYATGYKSGGFQPVPFDPATASITVDQEEVETVEVGVKSTLWGGRATLNAAAFYYDYQDFQVTQIVELPQGGATSLISNAAAVENLGVEVEATARLLPGWDARVGYTYLDATYEDFDAVIAGSGNVNVGGERLPRAPEHQFVASTSYQASLTDRLDLILSADGTWQSETFLLAGGDFLLPQVASRPNLEDSYGLLNLNATLEDEDSGFYGGVWVRNVTDTEYRTGANVIAGTPSVDYWGAPRLYGVRIGWRN